MADVPGSNPRADGDLGTTMTEMNFLTSEANTTNKIFLFHFVVSSGKKKKNIRLQDQIYRLASMAPLENFVLSSYILHGASCSPSS